MDATRSGESGEFSLRQRLATALHALASTLIEQFPNSGREVHALHLRQPRKCVDTSIRHGFIVGVKIEKEHATGLYAAQTSTRTTQPLLPYFHAKPVEGLEDFADQWSGFGHPYRPITFKHSVSRNR